MYSKGVIADAGQEGARLGVVLNSPPLTQSEIEAKVLTYLAKPGFTDPDAISVTSAGGARNTPLAVHVTYS